MMSEKVITLFGLIFVTSYVAKYVGPGIFGQIAFATSLFQIAQIISQLGSDVVIFKRISKNRKSGVKLLRATFFLRFLVYLVVAIPVLLIVGFNSDFVGRLFIFSCFLSCLFSSLDVFNIYYDSLLESKKNTIINVVGLVTSLLLRWGIALLLLPPVYLAIPIVLTGLIPFLIRLIVFSRHSNVCVSRKKHKVQYTKFLFKTGMTFVVSSLSVAIYTRMSMLTLGYLKGDYAVGIFSVAVTLSTSWAFVCNSFITSTMPSIFSEKDDDSAAIKTARLSLLVVCIGLPVFFCVFLLGPYAIHLLYGEKYTASFYPLVILTFSTMISMLGVVSSRYIAKYSGYAFLSKKMLSVCIFGFFINIIFVYKFGIIGAAFSTLLTEILSLTVFNYFFRKGMVYRVHRLMLSLKCLKK